MPQSSKQTSAPPRPPSPVHRSQVGEDIFAAVAEELLHAITNRVLGSNFTAGPNGTASDPAPPTPLPQLSPPPPPKTSVEFHVYSEGDVSMFPSFTRSGSALARATTLHLSSTAGSSSNVHPTGVASEAVASKSAASAAAVHVAPSGLHADDEGDALVAALHGMVRADVLITLVPSGLSMVRDVASIFYFIICAPVDGFDSDYSVPARRECCPTGPPAHRTTGLQTTHLPHTDMHAPPSAPPTPPNLASLRLPSNVL